MSHYKKKKTKYSIMSNFCFEVSNLWKYDKKFFVCVLLEIIISVVAPVFGAFVTAYVVDLAQQGGEIIGIIAGIIGIFAAYGVVSAISTFLLNSNWSQFIEMRLSTLIVDADMHGLEMYLDTYDKSEVRLIGEEGMKSLMGNDHGIEGFYHNMIAFLTKAVGLVTYVGIIGSLQPIILIK